MRLLRPRIADVPPGQRAPLTAARRRASVLATVGASLVLSAGVAVIVGQDAEPRVTFVTPDYEATTVEPAGP
jgi:hypothetical protein